MKRLLDELLRVAMVVSFYLFMAALGVLLGAWARGAFE